MRRNIVLPRLRDYATLLGKKLWRPLRETLPTAVPKHDLRQDPSALKRTCKVRRAEAAGVRANQAVE